MIVLQYTMNTKCNETPTEFATLYNSCPIVVYGGMLFCLRWIILALVARAPPVGLQIRPGGLTDIVCVPKEIEMHVLRFMVATEPARHAVWGKP